MLRIRLPAMAGVLLLGACAGPTTGRCSRDSICPIVIYETLPGRFATYPDHMSVVREGGRQTLIWTFADSTKYKFSTSTGTGNGDGVELIGANGSVIGMTSCFVTTSSRPSFKPSIEGPYYRCEIVPGKDFDKTAYRIRFRAMDGSPRSVDPTVSSTGSGDQDPPPSFPPVSAVAGQDVVLPPKGSGVDGYTVIWDGGSGSLFKRGEAPMVFKDSATGKEVDIQPCFPSSSPAGASPEDTGRYYACIFYSALPLAYTYEARYTDAAMQAQTRKGKVSRP